MVSAISSATAKMAFLNSSKSMGSWASMVRPSWAAGVQVDSVCMQHKTKEGEGGCRAPQRCRDIARILGCGMRNLLTDIPGIAVGHATDIAAGTGATAILFDQGAVASA